ncbi:host-nuclease inhibitor Gam family protein [Thermospira aquatica]|uniref:Host-nuclease inhibitor Gam family protein n=1 Tax=Thermospira aquatica TaxID=2828656 RepID=A0AAX3BE61_9SPIR|nr:host-nuclease inhibitor Gam family protein [Thermospira aquatica]URA10526.1 host-nuclease inhibitor Gam family protein [Thermospira aquatica]
MAREKIRREIIPLQTIEDVDNLLLKIARRQIEIERINADAEEKILAIKEEAKARSEKILEEITQMADSIFAYSELNKIKIFTDDKKTIELQWGMFGYRKSTKISTSKVTLQLLKELGFTEAIRIKETVNKEEMRNWDDAKLAAVKAKKVIEDTFWYEVNKEKVLEIEMKKRVVNT